MTKVEFPKFWGDDLKSWLYKCEQFFMLDNVGDEARVKLAAIHLEGKALQWHQAYLRQRENAIPTWTEYVAELNGRFGDLYDDPMSELVSLKHRGSVKEYHDSFDTIVSRLTLSKEYVLSCFLAGFRVICNILSKCSILLLSDKLIV